MAIVTSQLLRIMTELGFNVSTHTHTNNHTICLGLLRPTQSWNLPWLSKTISQLIKKRNYYFKKAHHSGSSVDYSKFKQLRNKVITELRLAKRRFFSNHNPQNPKEFWKIIRSLSPRESSSHLWRVKISLLGLLWTRPIFWTSPSPTTTIVQFQNSLSLISLKLSLLTVQMTFYALKMKFTSCCALLIPPKAVVMMTSLHVCSKRLPWASLL